MRQACSQGAFRATQDNQQALLNSERDSKTNHYNAGASHNDAVIDA